MADAGGDVGTCAGTPVQIGTAAVAGQTYSWAPGGATTAQISVSPLSTTVYTVTASNRCDSPRTASRSPSILARTRRRWSPRPTGRRASSRRSPSTWNAAAGAADYTLEIATDAGFTAIVRSATDAATSANVTGLPAGTYFWRVISNAACSGAPSAAFTFSIASAIFDDGFETGSSSAWSATIP